VTKRTRKRHAGVRTQVAPLSLPQLRWLGALLIAVQLPQTAHVPLWVAATGILLVGARLSLAGRRSFDERLGSPRALSWLLALVAIALGLSIRQSYGYFLGRDPCVAFLFVLVGIKFLETRSARDGTLLVCLACFLIVTPFFYSQSLLAAAAALPAMVVLGAALGSLAVPPSSAAASRDWRQPLRATVAMLVQGIPLAALLFLLFPRISGPLWGLPSDHAAKTGLSDRMAPGQISELSLSDAVAFRVDFRGDVPPPALRYWRGPVLSTFDGRAWTLGPRRTDGTLAGGAGAPVEYTVTLEPHGRPWLFALDLPASLPQLVADPGGPATGGAAALLTRDQQLVARTPLTRPLQYVQTSILADGFAVQSGPALATDVAENTRLPATPGQRNPRTVGFARELRRAAPDDAAFVRAVLAHFRNEPFHYTLEPPLLGADPVDDFLFDTRRGFCEHYASAFTMLLRAAGIPARVVTGYQGGEINPSGGYMIVRQSDAHAWAEALLDGRWRRFDPTGAVAPSRIEMGLGGALPAGEPVPLLARLDATFLKRLQLSWDALNHGWRRHVVGFNYERQRSLWQEFHLDRFAPWQIAAGVAAITVLWSGALLGWLAWRRRRRERERVLWESLCARLARAGLPRAPHEGPLAYSTRAAERWPDFAAAFAVIGDAYAALRYGPASSSRRGGSARSPALARLEHAIAVLPSPRALRAVRQPA
jgi:transglutaminase-like putative cysteine protease